MRLVHSVLIVAVSCLPAAMFACVGDTNVPAGTDAGVDAAADASQDSASDAGGDAAADAGPKCNYPDGGAPGVIDQVFQNGVRTEVGLDSHAADVDLAGNIYVASMLANCVNGSSAADIAVFKYLPTGLPDTNFGTGGRLCIDISGNQEIAWSVRADPAGGSILVTGAMAPPGPFNTNAILVARVKADGTLDGTFGTGGIFTKAIAGMTYPVAYGLAFDNSTKPAKLVVVGADGDQYKANVGGFVTRLSALGQPDNGFNVGAPVTDLTTATGYYGAAADSAGNIFVTGSSRGASRDLVVRKLSVSGTPDALFGAGGTAKFAQLSDPLSEGRGVIVLPSGKVVVAGIRENEGGTEFIAQLTSAGVLDPSFASASTIPGALLMPSLNINTDLAFSMLSPRCDGQFLVSGSTVSDGKSAVGRVSASGTVDLNFGTLGAAVSASAGLAVNAVEDPVTGRILLIGRAGTGALIERYNP